MRRALATAAGATLGFVYNNTRGALIGGRMAFRASRNGKRKRSGARSTYTAKKRAYVTPAKRARSTVRAPAAKRLKRTVKSGRAGRRGGGSRKPNPAAKTGASAFSIGSGRRLGKGFKRTHQPVTFTATATQRVESVAATQAIATLVTYRVSEAQYSDTSGTGNQPLTQPLIQSAWTLDNALLRRAEY